MPPLLALALAASLALGAPAWPSVAVLPVVAPDSVQIERAVTASLRGAQLRVAPPDRVRPQLRKNGRPERDPIQATAALFAARFVLRVARERVGLLATLYRADGAAVGRWRFSAPRSLPKLRRLLGERVREAIDRDGNGAVATVAAVQGAARPTTGALSPAPAGEPSGEGSAFPDGASPVASPALDADATNASPVEAERSIASASSADERPMPVVVDFDLGGGTLGRWLDYKNDLFNALGSYALPAGPLVSGGLALYPGALWTRGLLADVGLVGDFEHSLGLTSSYQGTAFPTLDDCWTAGLRLRIPIDASELGVSGRYGEQAFRLGALPWSTPAPIPNYSYVFVEPGLDARVQLGLFALLLDASWLDVVGDGIAASGYFPHASVGAVAGGLHLAFALWDALELRVGADYQRYFFSFNPVPGDAHVAGGALDQYLAATAAVALRIR
ncbi:MAG: hypothetical protein ACYCWW_10700 [Deltaproteobacteria bacterium]